MGLILSAFRRKTPVKVLIAGLDSAGKTTILQRLKHGPKVSVSTMPTLGFNAEVIEAHGMVFSVWDVGGQDQLRPFWRHYFTGTQALVYVVDSNDDERIEKSALELHTMMQDREMRFACLLVLANKSDLPYALSTHEITGRMRLSELAGFRWQVIRTCAKTGEGLREGLQWIAANVKPL